MPIVHYHISLEPQISSRMSLLDWENHLVKVLRNEFGKQSLGSSRDIHVTKGLLGLIISLA